MQEIGFVSTPLFLFSNSDLFWFSNFLILYLPDFGFDKQLYNVLEVNKTSYESCIDKDYIYNVTRGGRDVFHLTEAKTYYFLSGRGYCYKGMKVAVFVEQSPPELHRNHGLKSYPYTSTNFIIILTMLATMAIISY